MISSNIMTSEEPKQAADLSSGPILDNRQCRIRVDQTIVAGCRFPAGSEFTIQYRFKDSFGQEWCNLLRSSGHGISHCRMENVEVL